jgi:hypothetical protein
MPVSDLDRETGCLHCGVDDCSVSPAYAGIIHKICYDRFLSYRFQRIIHLISYTTYCDVLTVSLKQANRFKRKQVKEQNVHMIHTFTLKIFARNNTSSFSIIPINLLSLVTKHLDSAN